MTFDEFIFSISRPLPWGQHLYGIDIHGLHNTAYRVIDFDTESEVVTLMAVGDCYRTQQHISDLYEIDRDVCSCGDTQCEWHEKEEA